jgi:hypothetical protein
LFSNYEFDNVSCVNITSQRLGVYSGYVFVALLILGFGVVAGFFPPPSPNASAQAIQHLFQIHSMRIRIGMLISLISSAFLLPWSATVITQVRRVEVGRHTPVVYLQLVGFGAFVILFVYPEMVWALAAYRPEDPAELIRKFNDFAWLGFVCIVSTGMMQMLALGYVVLRDKRPTPIYPRWFGYFNIWIATMFIPADIIFFFKTGPMAWNGIIGFGLSFGAYFTWTMVVTVMTGRAVTAQAKEPQETSEESLAAEVAALRAEVRQLAETHAHAPVGTVATVQHR